MLQTIIAQRFEAHERSIVRGIARQRSADRAAANLRAATRYYERHVIAWYALDRLHEARVARQAIARHWRQLAAEPHDAPNAPIDG
jgi:hypothetical protein